LEKKQDIALLQKLKDDNIKAFEEIYKKYYRELFLFALKFCNCQDSANEVVQDLFVSIWESRDTLKIEQSLKAYLYKSVLNNVLRTIKKQKRNITCEKLTEVNITCTDQELDYLLYQNIEQAINELPDRMKEVFILSRIDGVSNDEISKITASNKHTIENQITEATKRLKDKLSIFRKG